MTYTVGVGRHSNEEVDEMFRHDLMMLSELLGRFLSEWTANKKEGKQFVEQRRSRSAGSSKQFD